MKRSIHHIDHPFLYTRSDRTKRIRGSGSVPSYESIEKNTAIDPPIVNKRETECFCTIAHAR
jgi:hypothetical protein